MRVKWQLKHWLQCAALIVLGLGLLGGGCAYSVFRYRECRAIGHSTLYCAGHFVR